MAVKVVAIGNRLMGDDGIGIKVAEHLSSKMVKENMELVIGETDSEYALSQIDDGDLLFIIDSTYSNLNPGTVTLTSLNDLRVNKIMAFSQHQPSLIQLIKIYGKKVNGFVIGVEVDKVEFSLELSETLQNKFVAISEKVYEIIMSNKIFPIN